MSEMEMMIVVMIFLLAVLLGIFFFRRRYFRLYQTVQRFQKQILEGEEILPGADTEKAEAVIRDGFLRIQKKYNREAERIQKDRAAVQGLISDLSHQLKTPLANIRLYQELLSNRELPSGQRGKLKKRLGEQTDKLEWLLNALFQMVDLERGQENLKAKPEEIQTAIEGALAAVEPRAGAKHIRIEAEPSPGFLLVHDPKWTEEVFFNILENAVKYSPDGSKLHISYEAFETYGAVHIQDAAPVIPAEEYGRIPQDLPEVLPGRERRGAGRLGDRSLSGAADPGTGAGVCESRSGSRERKHFLGISPLVQRKGNVTSQLGTGDF